MLNAFNSAERTLQQWQRLFEGAGWRLVDVRQGSRPLAIMNQAMIATPI
jgi:hypothetical protein